MKNFKLYKNFIVIILITFISGGAIVYADFVRTNGSSDFQYGYGYGYEDGYGYGYGYKAGDPFVNQEEQYGFFGTDGAVTSHSASASTCTTATVTYTSDYLAEHRVAYGISSVNENATTLTGFETDGSISLTGLTASTTYIYVVGSIDVSGGSWPASQGSFTTPACSSSSSGGVVLESFLRSTNNAGNTVNSGLQKFQFRKDLKRNMIDSDVKELQKFLNTHGFVLAKSGFGSPGNETTFFGPRTQRALQAYQKANGITPSAGYFGVKTRALVNSQN